MFSVFNKIKNTKGQGIVEYALLLAFIVGLAMMLNGANLGGAVKNTFDSVASLLAGETVALTPEEADKKKMLTLADKLKNNFTFGNSWGVNSDGKMVLKGNYVCVYVTKDGTADIHVQDKTGNQGWYYKNPQYFSEAEKQFYNGLLADLNLSDKSTWAPSYTETDSQWSNGYAVMFGRDGNVSYWNMADSLNADNFRNANPTDPGGQGVDKNNLYNAHKSGANSSDMHTRITGITD